MANEDIVTYLANIVLVSRVDGEDHTQEKEAMENICRGIGARQDELDAAIKIVEVGNYKPTPVGRFSDKIRNLEDMIYTSVSDGDIVNFDDGKCPAWHFDFFLPGLKKLVLIRVEKGKIKTKERAWEKTEKRPVMYTYVRYGMIPELALRQEPLRPGEDWTDSTVFCDSLKKALEPYHSPEHVVEYAPVALCMPASHHSVA